MRNFLFFSLLISVGLWRVFADMNQPYTAPKYNLAAFHCPYSACGAYAKQKWHHLYYIAANNHYAGDFWGAQCDHCQGWSVWNGDTLVYPPIIGGVAPNPDLPSDIIKDFDEARSIINISPRGAAALLRLCVQKICFHLGEQGKRIDDDIASLVKKGLHPMVQKSLDIVRVVG